MVACTLLAAVVVGHGPSTTLLLGWGSNDGVIHVGVVAAVVALDHRRKVLVVLAHILRRRVRTSQRVEELVVVEFSHSTIVLDENVYTC